MWRARCSRKAERLIEVTHDALMKGIEAVRPGNTFGDIGYAIQTYVEAQRMSVVRDFCGHGLGRVFHAPPNVLHYGRAGTGPRLEEGMFFTIEPMVNLGRPETKVLADDWTAVTRDKSLSAQFEHSVGVTADGLRDLHPVAGGTVLSRRSDRIAFAIRPAEGVAPSSIGSRPNGEQLDDPKVFPNRRGQRPRRAGSSSMWRKGRAPTAARRAPSPPGA